MVYRRQRRVARSTVFFFHPLAILGSLPNILAFVVLEHVPVALLIARPSFDLPSMDADIGIDLIELFLRHRHSEPKLFGAHRATRPQWGATRIYGSGCAGTSQVEVQRYAAIQ
jgi:hypothetical protein